jgi:two-component system LytT family sensor kinase
MAETQIVETHIESRQVPRESRAVPWGWITLIWCAIALVDACQTVFFLQSLGRQHASATAFGAEFVSWLPWLLATPLVSALARRHSPVLGVTLTTVAMHLAAFVTISVVAETWFVWLTLVFNPWGHPNGLTFIDALRTSLPYQGPTFLIVYVAITTVTLVLDARDDMARKIAEAALLSQELSRAQLTALRGQVEPHFMFNTLNSIVGLVRDNRNDVAVSMIVGLSEFLRRTLEHSDRSEVTLAEEVEHLQRYIDIQKVRFAERLQVRMDIPANLLSARVPILLLQPIVENAIKHGIDKRIAGGSVRIAATREDANLCLSVFNDGPGLPQGWSADGSGVGLDNLRTRLHILHGDAAEFRMSRAGTDGVEVVVALPLKVE